MMKKHNYSSELLRFTRKKSHVISTDKDWRDHLQQWMLKE